MGRKNHRMLPCLYWMTVPTMTSFFIPRLWVVMAQDVEVASLFQPYWCRIADILGSHLGQVAGAVIEARPGLDHGMGHLPQ